MKKILFYFLVLSSLFLVFGFFWWQNFLLPVDKTDKSTKIFIIKPGESVELIAKNLHQQHLIKNPFGFKILITYLGIAKNIQAGDFRLSKNMSAKKIAQELTHGTLDVWITIPEGLRIEEVAAKVNSELRTKNSELDKELKNYEGYLFPDTYLIPKNADSKTVINIMTDNFNKKVGRLINLEKTKKEALMFNGLSFREVIILASLIEREAKYDEDRLKVASVLYNRINIGMKLDVDATVQYAISIFKNDWWPEKLTTEDLKIDSPYNTYLYSGLPPTPICNPGLSSIKAALFPAKTNFFYYLSDRNGRIHFSKTIEEHNRNIKKYLFSTTS